METRFIRGWLLRKPKPNGLRVVAGDGQIHEIEITPNVRWVELANTIASLRPDQIEAFNEKKKLIRAIRPDDVEEQQDVPRNTSLEQDPENARLITFAQLVAEAYKDSREFTAMAFDKLGELFQAVVRKSESQEKTITALDRMVQKLMLEKVADAANGVDEDGAPLTLNALLQGMLQGKMQAEAERALGAPTNGAPTNGAPSKKEGGKK